MPIMPVGARGWMLIGDPGPPCPVALGATSLAPPTRDRDHLECPVPETNSAVETDPVPAPAAAEEELVEESLVEEVSIDGMCGVY
jgi:mycofactocin precursor peptide MftA